MRLRFLCGETQRERMVAVLERKIEKRGKERNRDSETGRV